MLCVLFYCFALFASSFTEFTDTVPKDHGVALSGKDVKNVTAPFVDFVSFTDISCESVENVNLIKTSIGVFMLSRDNFFRLNLPGKEFQFIRKLKGIDTDAVQVEGCTDEGDNELLLVVAFDHHLNVYRSKIKENQDAADPVDKLTVYGRLRRILCFKSRNGDVYLVLGSNFTEAHGRLSLFKWSDGAFELLEEKNMQSISDLHVLQGGQKDVILSVRYAKRSRAKTSVQSFFLDEKQLTRAQILHIDVDVVQPFVFNGHYYFFGYSRRLKECTIHYMMDRQFFEHSKTYFDGKLLTASYGHDFLVCERDHEIVTYISPSMECYAAFQPVHNDLSNIIAYTDKNGSNYILLNYIRPYSLLIQLIEVKITPRNFTADGEEVLARHPYNFKGMLKDIKNFLFYRESIASEIRSTMDRLKNDGEQKVQDGSARNSERMRIHSGHLERVDIINPDLQTPTAIRAKFQQLKKRVHALRKAKRSAETLQETGDLLAEVLHVKNLIYDGFAFHGISKTADNKLIIKVPIQTKTMEADTVALNSSNSNALSQTLLGEPRIFAENLDASSMTIDGTIIIHDLNVENLNDLNWEKFRQGLFDKRVDKVVNGDLVLTDKVSIEKLETETVNDVPVKDFVTLHTDQDIEATFFVSKFYTTNLTAETVNGLNLAEDVARIGVDNEIQGPVVFSYLNVTGDLQLAMGDDDNFARHIIGTRLEDLSQIYTGEIIINGSLRISNLTLDHPDTLVLVGENKVDFDFENIYWMKSVDQNFGSVKFVNDIIAPKVQIDNLNGKNISSYLLRNENPTGTINLKMESVEIRGNIFLDAEYPSTLSDISRSAVRRNGRSVMQGDLHFVNDLIIDHLVTDYFNDVPISSLVTQGMANVTITGKKTLEAILVKDQLHAAGGIYGEYYNGESLNEILNSLQHRHLPMTLNNATFQGHVEIENFEVKFLNNVDIDELLKDMYENNGSLYLKKPLRILGDVVFEKDVNLQKLNDISWDDYVSLLVNRNEPTQVAGRKKFLNGLRVTESLQTETINDLNISHWYKHAFTKHGDQEIEAAWVIENAEFHDLFTNYIDDVPTQLLIDTRQPLVQINGNILIQDLYVTKNVSGRSHLDFQRFKSMLSDLTPNNIKELTVLKNVEWPETDTKIISHIQDIIRYAVRNGTDQHITESILFSKKIGIRSATDPTTNLLNNIDIIAIANDSLLRNALGEQIFYGEKHFSNPLTVTDLVSKNFLGAPVVNGIDIMALNASMFRLTDGVTELDNAIYGHKEFLSHVTAKKLTVYGMINECSFQNVVLQSHHTIGPLPAISINHVHIENIFEAVTVNGLDFREFLRTRLRKTGGPQDVYGYLTMENLRLGENATVWSINGIKLSNVIVKNSDVLQEVTGHKTIHGDMILHGPAHVVNLNNHDVTNEYQSSLFLNQDMYLSELVVDNAILDQGVNISNTIDGYDVSYFLAVNEKLSSIISNDMLTAKEDILKISREPTKQQPNFMYLEIDDSVQFTYNQTTENYIRREIFESDELNDCLYREMSYCSCLEEHCRNIVEVTPYSHIYVSKVCGPHHPWLGRVELSKFYVTTSNMCLNERVSSLNITWIDESDRAVTYIHNYNEKIIVDVKLFDFLQSKASTKYAVVQLLSKKTNQVLLMLAVISLGEKLTFQESLMYDFDLSKKLSDRENIKVKLFPNGDEATLILSLISYSESGYHHNENNSYNASKILIYRFNHLKSRFELKQEIPGYYNIFSMTHIDVSTAHIAVGCDICSRVIVYSNSPDSKDRFAIKEVIRLGKKLSSLELFTTKYGDSHMIVTCKNSNSYNLYKYYPLRGWEVLTSGHERGLAYITSIGDFSTNGYHYILTMSSQNEAKALMMYTQG